MLVLAVKNSEADLQDYKLLRRIEYIYCKRCKHKWTATLEHMLSHPECPRCLK